MAARIADARPVGLAPGQNQESAVQNQWQFEALISVQQLLPPLQLPFYFERAWRSGQVPFCHRTVEIEDFSHILPEKFVHGLQFRKSNLVDGFALPLGQGHDLADDMVRLPERQAPSPPIIPPIRCEARLGPSSRSRWPPAEP